MRRSEIVSILRYAYFASSRSSKIKSDLERLVLFIHHKVLPIDHTSIDIKPMNDVRSFASRLEFDNRVAFICCFESFETRLIRRVGWPASGLLQG